MRHVIQLHLNQDSIDRLKAIADARNAKHAHDPEWKWTWQDVAEVHAQNAVNELCTSSPEARNQPPADPARV